MKKKRYQIIGSVFGVLVIGFVILYSLYLAPGLKELKTVRNMPIYEVDLSKVADGSYKGDFSFSKSYYEVEVSVKNHSIEKIKVLRNGTNEYAKKAEGVLQKVLSAQSLKVDVVTGATTTSKSLLKATENALNKGLVTK